MTSTVSCRGGGTMFCYNDAIRSQNCTTLHKNPYPEGDEFIWKTKKKKNRSTFAIFYILNW